MLNQQSLQIAQQRHSHFYLAQLGKMSAQYKLGEHNAMVALNHFSRDLEQIQQSQAWVADYLNNPDVAQLCNEAAVAGSFILNTQISSSVRLPWYENAVRAAKICADQKSLTQHWANLGLVHMELGQYERAKDYYGQALDLIEATANFSLMPNIYSKLGRIYYYEGDYDKAFATFEDGLALSHNYENPLEAGLALEGMAIIARKRGQMDEAIEYVTTCQQIFYDINYDEGISSSHINLGNIFANQGRFEESTEHYRLGLVAAKKLNLLRNICSVYSNMGANALELGNYGEAESCHRQSLEIARQIGDQLRIGRGLSNIGFALYYQEKYDEAEIYYLEALPIREEIGHKLGIADTLNRLGKLAIEQGRFAEAQAYNERALQIVEEIDNNLFIALIVTDLAEIALAQRDFEQARLHLIDCLEQMEKGDSAVVLSAIFVNLAQYFYHQQAWAEVSAVTRLILENPAAHADMHKDAQILQSQLPPDTQPAPQFDLESMATNIGILLEILRAD